MNASKDHWEWTMNDAVPQWLSKDMYPIPIWLPMSTGIWIRGWNDERAGKMAI